MNRLISVCRWCAVWLAAAVLLAGAVGCSDPEAVVRQHVERGQLYLESDDVEKARVEFLSALRIEAGNARARYGAGQAFERLGSLREALGHYAAGAELEDAHLPSLVAVARLLVLAGEGDQASTYVDQILAVEPLHPTGLGLRASVAALRGDSVAVYRDARRSVELDPANEIGVPVLAAKLTNDGAVDEAVALLERAVRAQPDDVGLRGVLAQTLARAERTEDYLAQLAQLMALQPGMETHATNYARALVAAGRAQDALRLLRARADAPGASHFIQASFLGLLASVRPLDVDAEYRRLIEAAGEGSDQAVALELSRARYLVRQGRSQEAEGLYHELIAADSDRTALDASVELTRLWLASGRNAQAQALLDEVRAKHPESQAVLVLASQMALRANPEAAIADLRLALRDDPDSARLRRLLGQAHVANGQLHLAERELAAALDQAPRDARVALELAEVRLSLGRAQAAREIGQQVERSGAANVVPALELQFRALLAMARFEPALDVARRLANVAPDDALGPYLAGVAEQALGRPDAAELAWRDALQRAPGTLEPLSSLVRLQLSQGRMEDARMLLEAQRASVDNNLMVRKFQGDVEAAAGNYQQAMDIYRACIDVNPQLTAAWQGLARALAAAGRWPEAVDTYRQAIERTGDSTLVRDLANAQHARSDVDGAIATYRGAVASDPDDRTLVNNLAMLIAEFRPTPAGLDEALELVRDFERVERPALLDTLGWVRLKRGELEAAIRVLERAVDLAPESALLRYHLGKALAENGDRLAARDHLEKAMSSSVAFAGRDDAEQLLAALARS